MAKKIKKAYIKELLTENPNVDRRQLEEVLKLLEILHKKGIKQTEYSLISPYSRIISGKSNA